jgi:heme/copper-type cytochrome/quinol oxidase subunit 2
MAETQSSGGSNTAIVAIVAIVLLVVIGFLFLRVGGFRRHDGSAGVKGNVEISVPKPSGGK